MNNAYFALAIAALTALATGARAGSLAPADTKTVAAPPSVASLAANGISSPLGIALRFLGVQYGQDGFDCSGFVKHVFEAAHGIVLPRRAEDQAMSLQHIGRAQLRPGDLVFFNTLNREFSHVSIYLGDDRFIHSPSSGGVIRIEDMTIAYWSGRFTGARRVT